MMDAIFFLTKKNLKYSMQYDGCVKFFFISKKKFNLFEK